MTVTKTFEPIRPIYAPDDNSPYYYRALFGDRRVDYGSCEWPSRSLWMVPCEENERLAS